MNINFQAVAPYLRDPLVLIGFFLFLAFLFLRVLLQKGIIPPLGKAHGYSILRLILLYGFVIGLALIGLGFALRYRELQAKQASEKAQLEELRATRIAEDRRQAIARADREAAIKREIAEKQNRDRALVALFDQELEGNLRTVSELKRNTETLLKTFETVVAVTRHKGVPIMSALFPLDNLTGAESPQQLAVRAVRSIDSPQLLGDTTERQRYRAAATAVRATLSRTQATVRSLADSDGKRYRFATPVWDAHQKDLPNIAATAVTDYQRAFNELHRLRANYDVVTARLIDYFTALNAMLEVNDPRLGETELTSALTAERLALSIATAYGQQLVDNIVRLRAVRSSAQNHQPAERL